MGGSEQLARLAGGSAGVCLAIAAAFPFNGVPPHGVSGRLAPAQIEVRTLAADVFTIDPLGEAMQPTAFPAPGAHGGPSMAVTVINSSPLPARLSIRLEALSSGLDDAATVRASGAGEVLVHGSLRDAANWSKPVGVLDPGAKTTVRLRFKLKPGISPDAYGGRLDIRQLEFKGTAIRSGPDALTPMPSPVVPSTPATTPEPMTTPVATVTPTITPSVTGTPVATAIATTTPRSARH